MPLTINDAITIGSYTFTYNPAGYSVTAKKFVDFKRTISGKMRSTGTSDGEGGVVKKKTFSIDGVSHDQLDAIEAEFDKNSELDFVSPDSKTYRVRFVDFGYSMSEDKPKLPTYQITLEEV